jgi:hypothetical protein
MVRKAKYVITLIYMTFLLIYFKLVLFVASKKKFVFVDIDNTIANTWPYLDKAIPLDVVYKDVPPFLQMVNLIKNIEFDKDNLVVFLSARNPRYYKITRNWLFQNGLRSFLLLLVPSVENKITVIKLVSRKKVVVLFDDLSFNHEAGDIKYYEGIIHDINQMENVKYYDYKFLKDHQEL